MAQNLTQHSSSEDEIDIREIVKLILDSKKILISTILVFTISSVSIKLTLYETLWFLSLNILYTFSIVSNVLSNSSNSSLRISKILYPLSLSSFSKYNS